MNIDELREFCLSLPHVTEDVKWGQELCFCVGEKMFCVTGLEPAEGLSFSFKCTPEKFAELTESVGIVPAPYVARYHWVLVKDPAVLSESEIKKLIRNSYEMVFDKLPKKIKNDL
ncbi:MAG: MmcQ/YjbR family DNA-binding protein [Pyrinomonadaceae bacterium]|nr:MmcQ/YjbR family DNA-binding protein [Pyrinomonadaceae bacterium]